MLSETRSFIAFTRPELKFGLTNGLYTISPNFSSGQGSIEAKKTLSTSQSSFWNAVSSETCFASVNK
jgi:hypothetical protein